MYDSLLAGAFLLSIHTVTTNPPLPSLDGDSDGDGDLTDDDLPQNSKDDQKLLTWTIWTENADMGMASDSHHLLPATTRMRSCQTGYFRQGGWGEGDERQRPAHHGGLRITDYTGESAQLFTTVRCVSTAWRIMMMTTRTTISPESLID